MPYIAFYFARIRVIEIKESTKEKFEAKRKRRLESVPKKSEVDRLHLVGQNF